jgi:peroxiredoxin
MKILVLFLMAVCSFERGFAKAETLAAQLEERAKASAQKSPAEVKKVMDSAINELRNSSVMKSAKKKGDKAPAFKLTDIKRGEVRSEDLLKKGPLIISFYRGGWCPYCNLQLRDLQVHLSDIKKTGAELIAISPEAPDKTAETVKKGELDFYVLSDIDGAVAKSFGLTYKLPKDLITVYKKFGIDLSQANSSKNWELPLSATYIVNKKGEIIYSFIDADYKKRAETTELIKILQGL